MPLLVAQRPLGGYDNPYSLLFDGAAHYLSRTPANDDTAKSGFFLIDMRSASLNGSGDRVLLQVNSGSANAFYIILTNDAVRVQSNVGSVNQGTWSSTAVFRDVIKFGSLLVIWDFGNATAADRIRAYVIGADGEITRLAGSFSTAAADHTPVVFSNSYVHYIGASSTPGNFFSGQVNEIIMGSGVIPATSDIYRYNGAIGRYERRNYAGSYGDGGCRLRFRDATSTTTLGYDDSGNGNDWTLNSMATTDRLTESVANCHAIASALWKTGSVAIGEGGLGVSDAANEDAHIFATLGWNADADTVGRYWEYTITTQAANHYVGVGQMNKQYSGNRAYVDTGTWMLAVGASGNGEAINSSTLFGDLGTVGATATIAFAQKGAKIWYGIASGGSVTWFNSGNPAADTGAVGTNVSGIIGPMWSNGGSGGPAGQFNFGQKSWVGAPPSGFKGVNTNAMPTPPVRKASKGFCSQLWTGDGSTSDRALTGFGMQADFAWMKDRGAAANHVLIDSQRSGFPSLFSNSTAIEIDEDEFVSFDVDGITIKKNASYDRLNFTGGSFVGWFWKRAAQFGFDIVTEPSHNETSTPVTINHSLAALPEMVIGKARSGTGGWATWHKSLTSTSYTVFLQTTAAQSIDVGSPAAAFVNHTTTTFDVQHWNRLIGNGVTGVFYLWRGIDGYSWFGVHTGNGNADGPLVYMGIRPLWYMAKRYDAATENWPIIYSANNPNGNPLDNIVYANLPDVEAGSDLIDFVAGGAKVRVTSGALNTSTGKYLGMAFGDPVKTAMAA
jgi:hypothetical protein